MQNRIREYELSISILRPLESEDRATVFFMRNQAVALSKMDLSLVMLGEAAMDAFAKLCDHSFITEKIKLTAPARRKHDDLRLLLQYLILLDRPDSGFSGTEIMNLCDDIKNEEAEFRADEIRSLLDYLDEAVSEKRKYLKKVHVPLVMFVAKTAKEKGMTPDEFAARLDNFFENLDPTGEYITACQSGSAKRTNVQLRIKLMSTLLEGDVAEVKETPPKAPKRKYTKKSKMNE
jgi:hypothetical protein